MGFDQSTAHDQDHKPRFIKSGTDYTNMQLNRQAVEPTVQNSNLWHCVRIIWKTDCVMYRSHDICTGHMTLVIHQQHVT